MWFQFLVSGLYNLTVLSTSTKTYLAPSILLFSSFSPTKFLLIGLQTSSSPFGYYQIKRIIMDYSDQVIMVSPVRKEVLNTLPIKKIFMFISSPFLRILDFKNSWMPNECRTLNKREVHSLNTIETEKHLQSGYLKINQF